MVRKHADSHQPEGEISASYGSWNKQRYVMDVQSPLNAAGNVRGRVIAGYQDNNSFIERYGAEKKFVYGVIDADLNDATTLSAGYEFQQLNTDSPMWGGLPRWYTDGSKTHFRRGFNTAPDWTYNDKESRKLFARLKHTFASGWQWTLNGTHDRSTLNSKMMYIAGYFDKNTGAGVSPYADYPVVAGTGYNAAKRQVDAVDTFASGPYQLFGRTHELMVGVSYSKQKTLTTVLLRISRQKNWGILTFLTASSRKRIGRRAPVPAGYYPTKLGLPCHPYFTGGSVKSDTGRTLHPLEQKYTDQRYGKK